MSSRYTIEGLCNSHKAKELQEMARSLKLSLVGNKIQLANRIVDYYSSLDTNLPLSDSIITSETGVSGSASVRNQSENNIGPSEIGRSRADSHRNPSEINRVFSDSMRNPNLVTRSNRESVRNSTEVNHNRNEGIRNPESNLSRTTRNIPSNVHADILPPRDDSPAYHFENELTHLSNEEPLHEEIGDEESEEELNLIDRRTQANVSNSLELDLMKQRLAFVERQLFKNQLQVQETLFFRKYQNLWPNVAVKSSRDQNDINVLIKAGRLAHQLFESDRTTAEPVWKELKKTLSLRISQLKLASNEGWDVASCLEDPSVDNVYRENEELINLARKNAARKRKLEAKESSYSSSSSSKRRNFPSTSSLKKSNKGRNPSCYICGSFNHRAANCSKSK